MAKKDQKKEKKTNYDTATIGEVLFDHHHLFGNTYSVIVSVSRRYKNGKTACTVSSDGKILLNPDYSTYLTEQEWFYLIAHQYLHIAFGHFDAEKITGKNEALKDSKEFFQEKIWKLACDLYNMKFLSDLKLGKCPFPMVGFEIRNQSEREIYDFLLEHEWSEAQKYQAKEIHKLTVMEGLHAPLVHEKGNYAMEAFAARLAYVAKKVLKGVKEEVTTDECSPKTKEAAEWFVSHYPLLGGLAAGFRLVESFSECQRLEIQIAAVEIETTTIYINPAARLKEEELKFVLAHEYLHAGLMHHERSQERNPYLWNVACDYVINGWLYELQIGSMPVGALYEAEYENLSAETIYDLLLQNIRTSMKLLTMRGYGKGDIIGAGKTRNGRVAEAEDFCRKALTQGLSHYESEKRGYLPLGLIEEIRALGMPPIPWDVELARWFEYYFPLEEKHYSYARPSRRQSSSPEIPRPRLTDQTRNDNVRTFGVLIDTSGSMSDKMLAMALGSVASYASAREVIKVRVIFCDARAHDAGYLSPDELAGRVKVVGRGGTVLQPGIDCLDKAEDFPKNGPILIITDGEIEDRLIVKREHAYLLPKGCRLPFSAKGKVFYMSY